MKYLGMVILGITVLAELSMQFSVADQPRKDLQKNPFIKPSNSILKSINNDEDQQGEMVLRATLTSDAHSIANINGEMLIEGESINGYELIRVDIGSAVLIKNGEEKLLAVNEKYKSIK